MNMEIIQQIMDKLQELKKESIKKGENSYFKFRFSNKTAF